MNTLRYLAPGILLALLGGACDGDAGAPPKTSFVVWVLEEPLFGETDARALSGATVVVDGATRETKTAELDGHATFELDLASVPSVSVTAFTADHTVVTMLEASPETARGRADLRGKPPSDLVVLLPRLDRALRDRSIVLRGALTNRSEPSSTIDLAASALPRLGSASTKEDAYEIFVPKDRAFLLLGHELRVVEGDVVVANTLLRTFRIESAPRALDATLDIDLAAASPVVTRPLRLRAELPGAPFSAATKATASVRSLDSQLVVAPLIGSKTSADSRARDLELALAEGDFGGERLTTRIAIGAPNGALSIRTELGALADGTTVGDFPLPPPIPSAENRTLADPIALDGFPTGAELRIQAFAGGQVFWIMHGPPGGLRSTTIALPAPSGIAFSTDVQIVALSIEARLDRAGDIHRRVAIAPDLVVRRQ